MGLHFTEVEPLGHLTQRETQDLAKDLATIATKGAGLSLQAVEQVLETYASSKYALSADALKQQGWFDAPEVSMRRGARDGHLTLSDKTLTIAYAATAPRMTFDEACEQIKTVRARLDAAPQDIEGITINQLYLFGSTLRDKNSRDTIGDLDLSADFGFDARYNGLSHEERSGIAKDLWNKVIAQGDDRLQIGDAKGMAENASDAPGKPFVVMNIWKHTSPQESSLTSSQNSALAEREQRTLSEQSRARAVATLLTNSVSQTKQHTAVPRTPRI